MDNTIAKRYVKALSAVCSSSELEVLAGELGKVGEIQSVPKYKDIATTPTVSRKEKSNFLIDVAGVKSPKAINLINLLAEKKRLEMVGNIVTLIRENIDASNGQAAGFIDTNSKMSDKEIEDLEKKISASVGVKVCLSLRDSSFQGVKVELPSLAKEVKLGAKDIKDQLINHILKAI